MSENTKLRSEVHIPFILAGKALIKFTSLMNGFSATYLIVKHKKEKLWFVFVEWHEPDKETRSGHKTRFSYIGTIFSNMSFQHTSRSKVSPSSDAFKGFKAPWKYLLNKCMPNGIQVEHLGRCGRCGRRLKDPKSLDRGFGPHCWKKIQRLYCRR